MIGNFNPGVNDSFVNRISNEGKRFPIVLSIRAIESGKFVKFIVKGLFASVQIPYKVSNLELDPPNVSVPSKAFAVVKSISTASPLGAKPLYEKTESAPTGTTSVSD